MAKNNGFTPVEKRMVDLLTVGVLRTPAELHKCLDDDLGGPTAIAFHISNIRKKIPSNEMIVWARGYYQRVKLVTTLQDE